MTVNIIHSRDSSAIEETTCQLSKVEMKWIYLHCQRGDIGGREQ